MGCSPWGHKELDTTEQLALSLFSKWKIQNYLWISKTDSPESRALKHVRCLWPPHFRCIYPYVCEDISIFSPQSYDVFTLNMTTNMESSSRSCNYFFLFFSF